MIFLELGRLSKFHQKAQSLQMLFNKVMVTDGWTDRQKDGQTGNIPLPLYGQTRIFGA
jgi:hypothetical protein